MSQDDQKKRFDIVRTPGTDGPVDKGIMKFVKRMFGLKTLSLKPLKPKTLPQRKPTKIK